jgi:uncharacterized protein (DUF2252 family)
LVQQREGPTPPVDRAGRLAAGKALRESVPRDVHARWTRADGRRDSIEMLIASNRQRVPKLVPIRYGRMLENPFTFLRGAAGLMARDLARTPASGLCVQACGDCHLLNFGLFATPERNLIFDINDFDETLPAPWEWDLKRLAISFAVAARVHGKSDKVAEEAAGECVRAYRERLRDHSKASPLEVWYDRIDLKSLIRMAEDPGASEFRKGVAEKARRRVGEHLAPKLVQPEGRRLTLVEQPPILFHVHEARERKLVEAVERAYRISLPPERRVLLDRYRMVDVAFKVVGIGSVGTRCYVALLLSSDDHPLLLQFKQASASVLEPYAGRSIYGNQGQRVVVGQRLMQSSSDIFLGWAHGLRSFDFFGRQLRDMKMSVPVEESSAAQLKTYAEICGWALARAHARSGDAARISGYLGKSDAFDRAIGRLALAYADQNERDHAALAKAVKRGRLKAQVEKDR